MLPRISLLDELRKGGFEAALITTFNAYLPFYEEVVLRRLVNAGVRHNVLLMDARQYTASLASHPPRLAGRQYTLLPVSVSGAFHPKLIFLAGKNKGLLFIGSHNMTLAGFGFNRELTNVVRIEGEQDAAGVALVQAVWTEIDHWLDHFTDNVPLHVKEMVRRVRDFAPWLKSETVAGEDLALLVGRPGGRFLWDQFGDLLSGDTTKLAIGGAFFDRELAFLKRVRQDLPAAYIAVAVDPRSVHIPSRARALADITLVRGHRLGVEEDKDADSSYLHAKGVLAHQADGSAVFASGSANPSAPAWMSDAVGGNVELMLARRGKDALAAAQAVGFAGIHELLPLDDADWQTIESNQDVHTETVAPSYRTGIAVAEDDRVLIDAGLLAGLASPVFLLCGADGNEIARAHRSAGQGESVIVTFTAAESAYALHVIDGEALALKLLLHHARLIEEQARTGIQRRFKEALLSLDTDTPNIELLIHCIDKIIFSEDRTTVSTHIRQAAAREEKETPEGEEPGTLAIDVSEVNRRKSKHRLKHAGDFAYLLDALIYHLRIQEDKVVEERDRFGRSEEEQIGADDEADTAEERITVNRQDELLRVCHARVGTVIRRMADQLEAFSAGKQMLADVLVRLLGVLAVLRELRRCDGRVPWVEKGKTTVPPAQRLRLLEAIMCNLFERNRRADGSSLLNLAPLGEAREDSDDIARLKGLILWLAWDCRLTLDLRKPFNETRRELHERLRRNAMVLALAQMIRSDEIVLDEARQSIGSLTASELSWLAEIRTLAAHCDHIREKQDGMKPAGQALPGDIAVHRTLVDWDLRVVLSSGGNWVRLIRLAKDKAEIAYRPDHLVAAPLAFGGREHG